MKFKLLQYNVHPCLCYSEEYYINCTTGVNAMNESYTVPPAPVSDPRVNEPWINCATDHACARQCVENYIDKYRCGVTYVDKLMCASMQFSHLLSPVHARNYRHLTFSMDCYGVTSDALSCKQRWRIHRNGPNECTLPAPLENGLDFCCTTPCKCLTSAAQRCVSV